MVKRVKFKADTPIERALKKKKEPETKPQSETSKPQLFQRNPSHKYGTCWQCGGAKSIPGGDFFKCDNCGWLPFK